MSNQKPRHLARLLVIGTLRIASKLKNNEKGLQCYKLEEVPKRLFGKELIMLFSPKEKGQGLVEYAIILSFVAIVVIAVMRLIGPKIGNVFSSINNSIVL